MKQEDFEKITKELNAYRENIERIAGKDIKVYALEGMGIVEAILNDYDLSLEPLFDIIAYINDNFYGSIEQEGYNFTSWIDKRTKLIMSFDDLESEIELCNARWLESIHGTILMNALREEGSKEKELLKINNDLFESKIQLAIAVESLLDSFLDRAKEEVWV